MSDVPFYPVNDFGPLMKGMVIGGVGILHVFLAQFAIGGGIGALLLQNIRGFNYERTAAIVILMVVAVVIIDNLSQAIRKRLI